MRLKEFIYAIALMVFSVQAVAQEEEETTFTDDALKVYASVMKWAEDEKANMSKTYNGWIKDNVMISAAKFNELRKAEKKEELDQVEATDDELTAYNEIQESYKAMTAEFKEKYTTKIKEEITAGLYNKLRKALKADEELKGRYDAVMAELKAADEEAEEEPVGEDSGN